MTFLHSKSTNIHRLHHYVYANSTARLAATGFTVDDIGKRAYETATKTFWDVSDVVSGVPVWTSGGFSPTGLSTEVIAGDGSYIDQLDLPISNDTQDALDLKLDASSYVQHFLGVYTSLGALTTAYPSAVSGNYAQVDPGSGTDLETYSWDVQEGWVKSNATGVGAINTDTLPEGSTNLYFTAARVRSTLLTGLSLATNTVISSTDTVIEALGYLQKQISDIVTSSVTDSSVTTLTNKRMTARVGSTASSATPTINTDDVDIYKLTAQAVDITSFTTNLSGTPNDGDLFEIIITGTAARAITWGSSFMNSTLTLPTSTTSTNTLRVTLQWDTNYSKWVCVGVV
jgi:hypothetical protein